MCATRNNRIGATNQKKKVKKLHRVRKKKESQMKMHLKLLRVALIGLCLVVSLSRAIQFLGSAAENNEQHDNYYSTNRRSDKTSSAITTTTTTTADTLKARSNENVLSR